MWYARMHDTDMVIAEGPTYRAVSDAAYSACPFMTGGAPYYLTTLPPQDCSICIEEHQAKG